MRTLVEAQNPVLFFFPLTCLDNHGLSILFNFSKNHLLVLLILVTVSFISFVYFHSKLYDLFPSTNFEVFALFFFFLVVLGMLCLVAQSCPTLCNPTDVTCQAPLSMGII